MKQMNNFHEWLSVMDTTSTALQRSLAALTRLDRTQLLKASNELTWFVWEEATDSILG